MRNWGWWIFFFWSMKDDVVLISLFLVSGRDTSFGRRPSRIQISWNISYWYWYWTYFASSCLEIMAEYVCDLSCAYLLPCHMYFLQLGHMEPLNWHMHGMEKVTTHKLTYGTFKLTYTCHWSCAYLLPVAHVRDLSI